MNAYAVCATSNEDQECWLRSLTVLFVGVVALIVVSTIQVRQARAQDQVIKIATEGGFEPFNFTDPTGRLLGFDLDVTNAACAKAGLTCEWVRQDWDGMIPGLLAGRFDAISSNLAITDERKKRVLFTHKLYRAALRFVAKAGTFADAEPQSLRRKSIGAQRATLAASYLQKNDPEADIKLYDTQVAMQLDLQSGRIDALLADEIGTTRSFLAKPEGKAFTTFGRPVERGDGIGIAMRKDDGEVIEKLNKGIDAIRQDGTLLTLTSQYFPGFDLR